MYPLTWSCIDNASSTDCIATSFATSTVASPLYVVDTTSMFGIWLLIFLVALLVLGLVFPVAKSRGYDTFCDPNLLPRARS